MEKKGVIILIASLVIILVIAAVFLISRPSLSPSAKTILEECKSLSYSSESSLNLVFFSSGKQAEEYSDYLFSVAPYQKSLFNIYYIDSYSPECELYQGKAILCYNQELIKKASSCPNDIIVIIEDKPSNIRSSSYVNVVSINSNNNKNVLVHELGHALAFLGDEYVPATLPKSSKNCQKTCDLFEECFEGCSKEDYYRSVDNGVMRTLSTSDYGEFDKSLILEKLSSHTSLITGNVIEEETDCQNQEYYLIQGEYANNGIVISQKSSETGCLGSNGVGDFSYNLILSDDSVYTGDFNPEFIFTDSDEGGEVFTSDREFLLKIPAIKTSKSLEIIKETTLAEINLQDIDSRPCQV